MGRNPNQIKDPDKIPHSFEHLNFQKEDKNIHWKQRQNLPQVVLIKLDAGCEIIQINLHLSP